MKNYKLILYGLLGCFLLASCTENFDEINTDPQGFTTEDVSAKFFLTSTQVGLYAPGRFEYWRAHLIHSDRFAGHATFGFNSSWWSDGLSYDYNAAYTDATFGWLSGRFGSIKSFSDLTKEGGEFENKYMYAISLIIKGLYYQKYTETFGMVPFTEAGVEGVLTPKYDEQQVIYKGIIDDLDEAMDIIGDVQRTGIGIDDVGSNDVYCNGDLQQWKRLANTLKLRIGMRAMGAPDEDFANATVSEALAAPLLDDRSGSVTMTKDYVISEWASAAYGDIWNDFNSDASRWTLSNHFINRLRETNDPRLFVYADPAPGGSFVYTDPGDSPEYQDRLAFIIDNLEEAGADYTVSSSGEETIINLSPGQYIGQPLRVNGDTQSFIRYEMFSRPSGEITQRRGQQADGYPEIILTSAEAYFLQTEAALRGMANGDAQMFFASGIKEAMKLWGVSEADADNYIANQEAADISTGTIEEKMEKIAVQRWLAAYTDGFEAWAVVRKTGYPTELAAGVTNQSIFALGSLNGKYPQRLRYGSGAQENPNFSAALDAQGPDMQGTTLWFAKE